jgi:D-methionine transport system substrate-binding protein
MTALTGRPIIRSSGGISLKNSILLLIIALGWSVLLAGCGGQGDLFSYRPLKVGVTAGPHAEIMEAVKKVAEEDGLIIQIVEFNDYIQPNLALNQGKIDANSFQPEPYLEYMVKDRKFAIVAVAKTVVFPMGIYSKKIKTISELTPGAVVAIPNDSANGGRALQLMAKLGVIRLKPSAGLTATVGDISDNPLRLTIKELDAAQISGALADTDLAAINANFAITAGLVPARDALISEDAASPYANIIAVRSKDKDHPAIAKLVKAYQSEEVKRFIQDHYQGSVVAAW